MIYEIVIEINSSTNGIYDTEPFDVEANNEEDAVYKAMESKALRDQIRPSPEAQTYFRTLKSIKQK
jgi:hypothetical protein